MVITQERNESFVTKVEKTTNLLRRNISKREATCFPEEGEEYLCSDAMQLYSQSLHYCYKV